MMDAAKKIKPASEGSDDSLKTDVFGCLHIILRDCADSEAECHSSSSMTTNRILDRLTEIRPERNLVRAEVRVAFAEPPGPGASLA